jgi:tetratricopeptide (TPR) repeat protein
MRNLYVFLILIALTGLYGCAAATVSETSPDASTESMKAIKAGQTLFEQGCYNQALLLFFKANERYTAIDDLNGTALSLNNIGLVYRRSGKEKDALLLFKEAFELCLYTNNDDCALQALSNQAATLIDVNDLARATEVIHKAEEMTKHSLMVFGPLLRNKAILLIKRQAYEQAEALLVKALKANKTKNISEKAANHFAMGFLMAETNRFSAALRHYQKALAYDRQRPFYHGIADDLAALGGVYLELRRYALAAQHCQRSLKIYALLGRTEAVKKLMPTFNQASSLAGADPTVTLFFLKRWMEGQITDDICP